MATIQDYLNQIKNAIYGKDVRQAIHDGIQQCYYDGKAGAIDLEARQEIDSLISDIAIENSETIYDSEIIGNETVILSKNVSNFDFLDIYWQNTEDQPLGATRIRSVNGTFHLNAPQLRTNIMSMQHVTVTINGTSFTTSDSKMAFITTEGTSFDTGNTATIYRVVGIKSNAATPPELSDIRNGADGESYTSAGEAVRSQFNDIKSDLDLLANGQIGYTISWESGDLSSTGQEIDDATYIRTDYIPADIVREKSYHLNGTNRLYIFYYNSDQSFIDKTSFDTDGTFAFSANFAFVRFVVRAQYQGLLVIDGLIYDTQWKEDIDNLIVKTSAVESDVSDLKEELAGTANYEEGYYIATTGELVADEDYCVTEAINIEAIVSANFWYGTNDPYKVRLVSFNNSDAVVDYWGGIADSEYRNVNNFGTGATYVRFSFPKGYEAKLTSSVQSDGTYTTYWQAEREDGIPTRKDINALASSVNGNEGLHNHADSLANGSTLLINSNISIKKNKVYHLHAFIDDNFDTLYFGHGEEAYSLYFKLDNTNITFMTNGSEGSQLPHGLTLDTYIDFMLIVGERNTGTIILNTLGGVYTHTVQTVNGYKGNVFVRPSGCSLTDVFIGFSCTDFRQPIWMFGDSYFTHTSDIRWTYWLVNWGFARCLLNAFPGESSSEALPQFTNFVANCGIPKFAVWCLGMNDPDGVSAISTSWKAAVEQFILVCEQNGITPILATIPNVPNYSNYYKNEYVRASGYRYIDFAKAVGAEEVGSHWYDGALSSDNVHPSEIGARMLCLRAIEDVPELTLGNI